MLHRFLWCYCWPIQTKDIDISWKLTPVRLRHRAKRRLSRYVLEVTLQGYSLCRFCPSVVATSLLTATEEALADNYVLFCPGPNALMDSEFRQCLQKCATGWTVLFVKSELVCNYRDVRYSIMMSTECPIRLLLLLKCSVTSAWKCY